MKNHLFFTAVMIKTMMKLANFPLPQRMKVKVNTKKSRFAKQNKVASTCLIVGDKIKTTKLALKLYSVNI